MNELLRNLANLIKVKTIVTLVVVGVFAAMALTNLINAEQVMYITTAVISFYFGTQHEKK